jgi:hypothetical protein
MDLGLRDAAAVVVGGRTPTVLDDAATDLAARGPARRNRSLVAFLAARRNSYMTGANVNVGGGSDFT